jgi:hypothetical protein
MDIGSPFHGFFFWNISKHKDSTDMALEAKDTNYLVQR